MKKISTSQILENYILSELNNSALYKELAKIASNQNDYELLVQLSEEEKFHADRFMKIYKKINGKAYNPIIKPTVLNGSFEDILREKFLDESEATKEYAKEYIKTEKNESLRDAFYLTSIDENNHAMTLLYMISKQKYIL